MSDQNPYGGNAPPPPPGNPPPSGYGAPPPRSDRWKIWLGIGLTIPILIGIGVLAGAAGALDNTGVATGLVVLSGLALPIVLLFFRDSRKLGLGLLIGYSVLFILAAGACIALIASYDNMYG
jgi:hypothetical protein